MERDSFLAALAHLNLSQAEFARLAGVHVSSVWRWGKDNEAPVPLWAEALVIAWTDHPDSLFTIRVHRHQEIGTGERAHEQAGH